MPSSSNRVRDEAAEDGTDRNTVRLVESRQPLVYASVVADLGTFGARLDDRLIEAAEPQTAEYKRELRKLYKLKASHAAFTAELAAGRLPPSFAAARLTIKCHTGFADLDAAANAATQSKHTQFLHDVATSFAEQEAAGITRLTADIDTLKTVQAPAALTDAFNSVVAGSAYAQDPALQLVLQHHKKLLDLSITEIENQMREGAELREAKRLSQVEARTQLQQQRQQRQQLAGVTAESLAAAAAAAGAAAAVSAIPVTAAPAAVDEEMHDTQPLPLNQEQQQQQAQAHAAANAAMTPQQVAAAIQSGLTASITHLLQHGLMPRPPATPAQPRPRNRQPAGRQAPQQQRNRPRQQQQQPQQPQPRRGQQQPPRRAPNGPVPRPQAAPRHNNPQQPQQQQRPGQQRRPQPQQQPQPQQRRPNGAAGRANANGGYRRTDNGGNNAPQGRQPSR
jgi:hypothetical protein